MSDNDAIAMIDCNNFFVSCERALNEKLNGRPVVVLSNNDGCIISRSEEVKRLGVKMAQPLFQVRDLLEKHNTAIFSCNHALYREFTEKIIQIIVEDSGARSVELYSIDEAFVNIGVPDKLRYYGIHIKEKIFNETKIPVSVGIAETKTLAKLANHIAKLSAKTKGVLDLYKSPYLDLALMQTPVEDVWGVGRRSAARLKKHEINTAYELKNADVENIRSYLHIFGAKTVLELNGIKCLPIEWTQKSSKSIAHTRTFGHVIKEYEEIRNALFYFTTRALEKMRWNYLITKSVSVFLSTDRYNPVPYYYSNSYSYRSVYYSDVSSEIYKWVSHCLDQIFRSGLHYRRAGIVLSDLIPVDTAPCRLYEQEKFDRMHRLNRYIDEINLKYGRDVVKLAVLKDVGRWQSQSTHRSNDGNHTTGRDNLGLGNIFSRPIRFL
jgi:DNA polymerase V